MGFFRWVFLGGFFIANPACAPPGWRGPSAGWGESAAPWTPTPRPPVHNFTVIFDIWWNIVSFFFLDTVWYLFDQQIANRQTCTHWARILLWVMASPQSLDNCLLWGAWPSICNMPSPSWWVHIILFFNILLALFRFSGFQTEQE